MEPMTVAEILEAVNGTLLSEYPALDTAVSRLETDSRTIHPDSLFVPLIGEQFDGHAYIGAALESGAAGCLTRRERESYLPGKFYIKVKDTRQALRDLARHYKKKFDIPVVAVTGSVGKTTTKDMVAAVLGEKYKVLKTEGNLNTDIGTCLTVFRLDKSYEAAVLEMGMNHAGEIEVISSIAEPDLCLITNVGESHIEFLGSRENILKAKAEIFSHAKPGGAAILNGDDELLRTLEGKLERPIIWCGVKGNTAYSADHLVSNGTSGMSCEVKTPHSDFKVDIPALGSHMVYPTLMAAAVGERFGLTAEEICRGVAHFAPTKMRMNILQRQDGITILNDTYNANPQSMRAALEVLSQSRSKHKVAMLGDMLELGPLAQALHAGIGEWAAKVGIDCLVCAGELSEHIAAAAEAAGMKEVYWRPNKKEAMEVLRQVVKPDTTVLVKASRGMAFEELVEYLKELTKEA